MLQEDIEIILESYDIGHFITKSLDQKTSMANKVWSFHTNSGIYILKEFKNIDYDTVVRNQRLQTFLQEQGFHIPIIIKNKKESGVTLYQKRLFEIRQYIPGYQLQNNQGDQKTTELVTAAGEKLANIHNVVNPFLESILPQDKIINRINDAASLINDFNHQFDAILSRERGEYREKILVLKELIEITENSRFLFKHNKDLLEFSNFDIVLSHGDYSHGNLLFNDNILYVIDWDNPGFRPRAWEIQNSISKLFSEGLCNPYLDKIDYEKAGFFLKAYHSIHPLSNIHLCHMKNIAHFNFAFSWIAFTLIQILKSDRRIFSFIPLKVETALFWFDNVENYHDFINSQLD